MATFPIVLAHGIAPFDRLFELGDAAGTDADDAKDYFRRIQSTLRAAGFRAHRASVAFSGAVSLRARELKREVGRILELEHAQKVHIIAHSMGGLDARHLLFEHQGDRMHERIASLTTIGTPHLGTAFADLGVSNSVLLLQLLAALRIDDLDGFSDLTTRACREFDGRAREFELGSGVRFQTYAGAQALPFVFAPLQAPWAIVHMAEGDNDGLVSVSSAKWRPEYVRGVLDADHLNQIGWWDPNELGARFFPGAVRRSPAALEASIRALYLQIANGLEALQ